jgi:hypothetical protein
MDLMPGILAYEKIAIWAVFGVAILGLIYANFLRNQILKEDMGTEKMQQVWVAGKSGAFHYAREGDRWLDTRDGSELFAALSRLISAQGGEAVVLRG